PLATVRPGSVLGNCVNVEALHAAEAPLLFDPATVAVVHFSVNALTGTVAQPVNVVAVVPALSVQVPLLLLLLIVNDTVAVELPGMVVPGALALNSTVAGVADRPVMVVGLPSPLPPAAAEGLGVGRRVPGETFWARAGPTTDT